MNFRQLQYAVVLSQNLNISLAAEQLQISQPALSKQILSLEKELGVTLFDRNTAPLTLTPAGENFIKEAGEILRREAKIKSSMAEYRQGDRGRLVIGISPFRATYFLSDIILQLQKKYKGLEIVLNETNSTQLQKDAIEGHSDITVMNLPVDEALLDVIPLSPEPLVLVLPKCFAQGVETLKERVLDLADCKDIPFIVLSKTQELRQLFEKICINSGITPNMTTEVVGITTAFSLAKAGVGATILPRRFVEGQQTDKNILVFDLKNTATVRQPAIVMRKECCLSKYAESAIELITARE